MCNKFLIPRMMNSDTQEASITLQYWIVVISSLLLTHIKTTLITNMSLWISPLNSWLKPKGLNLDSQFQQHGVASTIHTHVNQTIDEPDSIENKTWYNINQMTYVEKNVRTRVAKSACAYERVIWVLLPQLRSKEGAKHQNNTWVSA